MILKWNFVETMSWQRGDKRQSKYRQRYTEYKTLKINLIIVIYGLLVYSSIQHR